jgi:hypothetical protein
MTGLVEKLQDLVKIIQRQGGQYLLMLITFVLGIYRLVNGGMTRACI